jgi:hypothetical protein
MLLSVGTSGNRVRTLVPTPVSTAEFNLGSDQANLEISIFGSKVSLLLRSLSQVSGFPE